MYESFYNLTARPFAPAPVVERYFAADAIETARQTIKRNIQRAAGPCLLIGPAGTGKSQLCHVLASELEESFQVVMLASAQLCTRRALLKNILFELGLPYHDREEGELRLALIDYLKRSEECVNGVLLLVDEAHALPLRLLEELRMITNLVQNGRSRVHLVLAGGSRLENRFADPRLESFSQRLAARCYLQAFNSDELRRYVHEQLAQVGTRADQVFADNAYSAIYQATGGVPRVINQLCDHAMVLGSLSGQTRIDSRGIEEAWADLQQLPAPWNEDVRSDNQSAIIEFGPLNDDTDSDQDRAFATVSPPEESPSLAPSITQDERSQDEFPALGIQATPEEGDEEETVKLMTTNDAEVAKVAIRAGNPFGEDFEEEEVILDHFASLDADVRGDRPLVECGESQQILSELHTEIDAVAVPPTVMPSSENVVPASPHAEAADADAMPAEDAPVVEYVPFTTTDTPLENPLKDVPEHDDSHLFNEMTEAMMPTDIEDPVAGSFSESIVEAGFFDPLLDPGFSATTSDAETVEMSRQDSPEVPAENAEHMATSEAEMPGDESEPSDTPVTEPAAFRRSDDRDIILIDDAQEEATDLAKPKASAYGQLFAKLRRN